MRIRKRHVLFSSLHDSTVPPPSDPHPNAPSPPVVQPSPVLSSDLGHQPSDQINGWDDPSGIDQGGAHKQRIKQDPSFLVQKQDPSDDDVIGIGREEKKDNHDRSGKGGIFGSQTLPLPPPQSHPSNQDWRWCEEEKSIPLKKRRPSFHNTTTTSTLANTTKKERIKAKINNKCNTSNNNINDDDEEKAASESKPNNNKNGGGGKKTKGRGSAVMEGSRCSRVNGRGWRCCQQTLVGYSLCEHHLGKGRLRSITSVRNRSKSVVIPPPNANATSSSSASSTTVVTAPTTTNKVAVQPQQHDHGDDDDEYPLSLSPYSSSSSPEKLLVDEEKKKKKPATIAKKRMMKVGMVKARSISSLMGQTITLPPGETNNK